MAFAIYLADAEETTDVDVEREFRVKVILRVANKLGLQVLAKVITGLHFPQAFWSVML